MIIAGSVSDEDAKKLYPAGWKAPKPYIRIVPQPRPAAACAEARLTLRSDADSAPAPQIFFLKKKNAVAAAGVENSPAERRRHRGPEIPVRRARSGPRGRAPASQRASHEHNLFKWNGEENAAIIGSVILPPWPWPSSRAPPLRPG